MVPKEKFELIDEFSQSSAVSGAGKMGNPTDSQLNAHDAKQLASVIRLWPRISAEIQNTILSLAQPFCV